MAASTIDPAIGASTWAFGSHKWVENIGNFTINPVINNNQNIFMFIEYGYDKVFSVIDKENDDV